MKIKLTISIDKQVMNSAKKYARNKNVGLPELIEEYLKSIATIQKKPSPLSQEISLRGSLTLPKKFNYKTQIGKIISGSIHD